MDGFRGVMVAVVAVALALSTIAAPASAAIVGTEQMLSQNTARQDVDTFLARAEVQEQLQDWGVELGKQLAKRILDPGQRAGLDASTRALWTRINPPG